MIMIKGAVGKKEYKEPFSKGIMARSLYITDLGHDEAYEIASCIVSNNIIYIFKI